MAKYTFEQIKIAQNENLNNPVINRALRRLFENTNSNSSESLPGTDDVSSPSILYVASNGSERKWMSVANLSDIVPYNPIISSPDILSSGQPPSTNGMTLSWNISTNNNYGGYWTYEKLKRSLADLDDVTISSPQQYQSLTYYNNKWTNTTQETYLGVGYVKHIVCTEPTVIILPSDMKALNGGEQIEITRIKPSGANANWRFPVLICTANDNSTNTKFTILNNTHQCIISDNNNEEFSSIHLRVCKSPMNENGFIWVPVSVSGTWRPTLKRSLNAGSVSAGADYDFAQTLNNVGQLTSNELRIQPYNLSVNINQSGIITKVFDLTLVSTNTSNDKDSIVSNREYKQYGDSEDTNIIIYNEDNANDSYLSIVHGVGNNRIVQATLYVWDNAKYQWKLIPNSLMYIWFNGDQFNTIYMDFIGSYDDIMKPYQYMIKDDTDVEKYKNIIFNKFKIIVNV